MSFKSRIQENARAIGQLHRRVHETYARRDYSAECRKLWEDACSEFHEKYDQLAFLSGTIDARERLRDGDTDALEYALDFLEVRPYFFRSGYMYNDFMRVLKNCPLSPSQRKRYDAIRERYMDYRENRNTESHD